MILSKSSLYLFFLFTNYKIISILSGLSVFLSQTLFHFTHSFTQSLLLETPSGILLGGVCVRA